MSTFTFNIYLVQDIDGDGSNDFVLHDDGRIVIETRSISVNTAYRYIGGQIAARSRPALSFAVRKRPNGQWYLMTNQQTFCGLYDSQAACIGVLYGIYTHFDGADDSFAQWLADALEKGSIIDPDENVLVLRDLGEGSAPRLEYEATLLADGPWLIMFRTSSDGVTFTDSTVDVGNGEGVVDVWPSGDLADSIPNDFWSGVGEDEFYKLQLFDGVDSYGNSSNILKKNEEADLMAYDLALANAVLGANVDAVITNEVPATGIDFDYFWFREIPGLTGTSLENLTNEGS